jgi:hypothetical protein
MLGIGGLIAAVIVFALMLRSERMAERVGILAGRFVSRLLALVRRPPVQGWEIATVKFRNRTVDLLEHGWVPITAATLVSHLSLYLVLLTCLRDVGVSNAEVNWAEVLAVFAFARLATAIPFTPVAPGWWRSCSSAGSSPPAVTSPRWSRPCWSTAPSPGCCRSPSASAPPCGGGAGHGRRRASRRRAP